jgi:histidine ammonia-lyase
MPSQILIDGHSLTPEAVWTVTDGGAVVRLAPAALAGLTASRQVIEQALASGKAVYGVNTGFGALSGVRIPDDQLAALQKNLVRSHAAGAGQPLAAPVVRAMMLLRANTLAKGVSGVRPVVVETLLALLNAGIVPVIPQQGSLGASGDLAPLAHLTLVLMGEGEAWVDGQCLPGAEALALKNIAPLTLEAKEGLALLNGTQMMTALGCLALRDAEQLADVADLAGAMTIEAVRGSHQPFDEAIVNVRPHAGHRVSAARIRHLLAGSDIAPAHRDCAKVQDPYSLRCIPQVHGASRDALAYLRQVLSVEVNAATDNPLVFPDGKIVSQGNFHGQPVAMALDFAAIAVAELASIAERRIDKLMNPVFSDLPAFLVPESTRAGLQSGLMIVHYTAASLVSENKTLSHPAVVDSIPTSNDKEDHVSMGGWAARKLAKIIENTRWVLAAELVCAAQGLEFRDGLQPGTGVWKAYQHLRQTVPPLTDDRSLSAAVAQLAENLSEFNR